MDKVSKTDVSVSLSFFSSTETILCHRGVSFVFEISHHMVMERGKREESVEKHKAKKPSSPCF